MIERSDANAHLMEELFDSSIPELLHVNLQRQKEATRMIAARHPNAPTDVELRLTPDYMKNKAGLLMVDHKDQRALAEEVLNGLHEALSGSEALEREVSDSFRENMWTFESKYHDKLTVWTVVEWHNLKPGPYETAISADIFPDDKRFVSLKELVQQEQKKYQMLAQEPRWKNESDDESTPKQPRVRRVAKSVGKWLNNQANQPPGPNSF